MLCTCRYGNRKTYETGRAQHPTYETGREQHPTYETGRAQHPTYETGRAQHPTYETGRAQHATLSQGRKEGSGHGQQGKPKPASGQDQKGKKRGSYKKEKNSRHCERGRPNLTQPPTTQDCKVSGAPNNWSRPAKGPAVWCRILGTNPRPTTR